MRALTRAAAIAAASFLFGVLGFGLHMAAPTAMLADAHGMIGSIAGLIGLLLALVLGLVIWTSHGVYTTQVTESLSLGPIVMQLDHAFEQLGPKGLEGRKLLQGQVRSHRERFWGEDRRRRGAISYAVSRADTRDMAECLARIAPADDGERRLVATTQSLSASMIQTQLLMARQLATPLPPILLAVVVGWSFLLFFAYGLSSAANPISLVMAALGAVAVASALLLIFELMDPYDGLFHIPPAGIDHVLAAIGVRSDAKA
ncbi:uncharacterized protein DUF4239 [Roseiarcus fermentans]|uniref:Uncharacterized protein DUF4239 n=1 Tax=Roseiarcus fermentans TaxID=1473586 RepID=A0A366EVM3_9HYPH|nr:DUF4239 domain-containing protein [Roseiarcus fermentans]RBP06451.1 uncharacterized protein DUF4239 [Roseiarcus fermentans]